MVFFQAEDGIRDLVRSRGLGDVYKRQKQDVAKNLKFRDEVFLKVFPKGGFLDVDGNWMFVSNMAMFPGVSTV